MDVGAPFVADGQPPEPVEPGQGALDHPAVATRVARWTRSPCGRCGPGCGGGAAPGGSAGCRRPCRRAAWPGACGAARWALDRRDGIEQLLEDGRVVAVGAGQERGERDAAPVDHNMALRARFAAIRRVRADQLRPPFGRDAGTVQAGPAPVDPVGFAQPVQQRPVQASQTPASCQSRSRRQQVMPEPQPSSWGSISQGMPRS